MKQNKEHRHATENNAPLHRLLQQSDLSSRLRETLEGVLRLHGQDIVDRSPVSALAALPGPAASASLLPKISKEQLADMREKLRVHRKPWRERMMMFKPSSLGIDSLDIFHKMITLDPKGNIISTGITFDIRDPLAARGVDVEAVTDENGNILDYSIPDTLNGHQEAALGAYFRSERNAAGREYWLKRKKCVAELATKTGIGPLIRNAIEVIESHGDKFPLSSFYQRQIKVIEFVGHPTFLPDDGHPLGPKDSRIEVRYLSKMMDRNPRPHFKYFVREGRLNPEAQEVFDFLKDAVEKSVY